MLQTEILSAINKTYVILIYTLFFKYIYTSIENGLN